MTVMMLSVFVHLVVIFFVVTRGDVVHPLLMVKIPTDSFLYTFFKLQARFPTQFSLEFGGVNGIAHVMTGTVGDVCDEVEVFAFCSSEQSVNSFDEHSYDVDVLPLVESSDVVCFGDDSVVEDGVDGTCVVFHIEPVSYVLSLAIYGQWFAVSNVVDEERYEFFRELVWSVVVGAVGDDCGHAVCVVECPDEVVAAGFAG